MPHSWDLKKEKSAETAPAGKAKENLDLLPAERITVQAPTTVEKPAGAESIEGVVTDLPKIELADSKEVGIDYKYIDLSNLTELSSGDPAFINRILGRIIEKLPPAIAELEVLLTAKDFDAIKKSAHSLKSSSGYAGSEELKEIFQKIESLALARVTSCSGYPTSLHRPKP